MVKAKPQGLKPAVKVNGNGTPKGVPLQDAFSSQLPLQASTEPLQHNLKETTMEKTKCRHPECDAMVRATCKSGCCTKHFYWATKNPANGNGHAGAKVKTKLQRKTAKAAAVPDEMGSATLVLTEEQLDALFVELALEDKARIIQGWLRDQANC